MVVIIKKNTPKAKLKALLKKSRTTKGKGFDARKHLGKLKHGEDSGLRQVEQADRCSPTL